MSTASALPEGAPWGSANPDADENCASCHFGYDAERDSSALVIEGLPDNPVAGKTYSLQIRFEHPDAAVAGFQLIATAGEFHSKSPDIEFLGSAIRSTRARHADAGFRWQLSWTAPSDPGTPIVIYMAVVGGNDDLSPFGDQAFFRTVETTL